MKRKDAKILIDEILKSNYEPNDWEENFLDSIANLPHQAKLSARQSECLQKIYDKSTGGGDYQKKEII